jgi:hypothetical protein
MKLAKYPNERFINYSIVCISVKDKIYEQNILTNVLSIIQ